MPDSCYHCEEIIPPGFNAVLTISNQQQAFCCYGCLAIAETIVSGGLENFYLHRTHASEKPDPLNQSQQDEIYLYDDKALQEDFVTVTNGISETHLSIGGITCAACIWLIERESNNIIGIDRLTINHTSHRAILTWNDDVCSLSTVLLKIRKLGYKASPYQDDLAKRQAQLEKRTSIFRIAVAGIATMQNMMFSLPLYLGNADSIDPEFIALFRWVSLIMCTPVVFFSALPFLKAALRDIQTRHLTMDLPVSIAILAAYAASSYITLFSSSNLESDVYFDSVAMFTFFLLLGRFFEMQTRHKHLNSDADFNQLLPATARVKTTEGEISKPAHKIEIGDVLIIHQGQVAPADGIIIEGQSHFDESALTGEFLPIHKSIGHVVNGGTANVENTVLITTTATPKYSRVAAIIRMLDQAQHEKPLTVQLADIVASYFVAFVLLAASVAGVFWYFIEPEAVFPIVLSILVVTCPCALSLATPTAMTSVNTYLRSKGLLMVKGHTLEAMNSITDIIFDKTGTLTEGKLQLSNTTIYNGISESKAKIVAAALEHHSRHPIANAFKSYFNEKADQVETTLGYGLQGSFNGKTYRLGNIAFALNNASPRDKIHASSDVHIFLSMLSDDQQYQLLAQFELSDTLRAESIDCVEVFQAQGFQVHILSGDHLNSVQHIAHLLGINHIKAAQSPEQKLNYVRKLQQEGKEVAMVGDGINDLPVLSGAKLSIAMGGASDITKLNSDAVLLNSHMSVLNLAFQSANRARKIIKQNMAWAIGYNLLMLPLAAMGLVPPYFAALGMSLSSLVVVFNSLRLKS
ncbi:MAG: Cu2+-exporting ATPase [Oleiphilaceae bacterium]|jgi:Cu2+-exporting ATPase